MARRVIFLVFLVVALLALPGAAHAEKGARDGERDDKGEKSARGDDAEREERGWHDEDDRRGRDRERDGRPDRPAPPAHEPAPPLDEPPASSPPAPPRAEPAPPPASDPPAASPAPQAPDRVWYAPPPAASRPAPLERTSVPTEHPTPAPTESEPTDDGITDARALAVLVPSLGAPADTFSAANVGATGIRAPASSAAGAIAKPAGAADEGAPWWRALAWALPIVGVGGVAAVLALRKHRLRVSISPTRPRMSPVTPFDVQGLLTNGQVAAARGAYDEAVAWFDRVVRIAPRMGVAYFCKGVCLAANGRVAQAYGALRVAVEHDPADPSYRVHFARVALALGKHKEAMDALELVTRAMPELGPAILEDPQLAGLRDHPRFLMICGAL